MQTFTIAQFKKYLEQAESLRDAHGFLTEEAIIAANEESEEDLMEEDKS